MARYFRLYGKKRGSRRTGSRVVGNATVLGFFAVTLLCGLGLLGWLVAAFGIPQWRVSFRFEPAQCTVLKKRVAETETDSGPAYRPEVLVRYQVDGRTYETWTYDVSGVYRPDRQACERLLERFTVGGQYRCWYDPAAPQNAVLVRVSNWAVWLVALLPLSFIVVGGGGLIYQAVYLGKSRERRAVLSQRAGELDPFDQTFTTDEQYPFVPNYRVIMDSPGTKLAYRLPVERSGAWALAGALVVMLATNATSALFVYLAIKGHRRGEPDWWLTAFTVPVIFGGMVTLVYFVRRLLMLAGLGPVILETSDHPLFPGRRYRLYFLYAGQVRLRGVVMRLVCEERTSFLQGTNARTERRVVFDQVICRHDDLRLSDDGTVELECPLVIPARAMHSFKAEHNEIAWRIVVHGHIAGWPDFERAYSLAVCPTHERPQYRTAGSA